jgi:hypothetical protein
MFRNAAEGARDLYVTRSADGGKTFDRAKRLGSDSWKLDACPMDGGGLAVDDIGHVTTVWRRELDIFTTEGEGRPERSLGSGRNPTVAVGSKGPYVAWTRDGAVLLAKPRAGGPESLAADGAFPSMVALGDGSVLVAWESNGSIVTRTVE